MSLEDPGTSCSGTDSLDLSLLPSSLSSVAPALGAGLSGAAVAVPFGGGLGLARLVSSATVGGEAGEERGKAALNSVNSAAGLGEEEGQVDQGDRGRPGGNPRGRMCGRVTRSA